MMNYDPFQTYNTLGQLYGAQSAMGFQHPAQLSGINPLLGLAQAGIQQTGQSQFGQNPQQGFINPQQLQLASLLATNPLLAVSLLNNPLLAATLHSQQAGLFGGSPFGQQQYPQFGQQQYPQFGQQQHPQFGQQQQYPHFGQQQHPQFGQQQQYPQFGQQLGHMGSPFGQIGYPLAPQSWIGQGGQFGQRPFQGQGLSPWGY
jgi:hypothetical protein